MVSNLRIKDACKYYKALPHQEIALDYLQANLPSEVLEKFTEAWRKEPDPKPDAARHSDRDLASRAKFVMRLKKQSALVMGEFYLFDGYGKQMRSYAVTSGAPGWQGPLDTWTPRKGPCPDLANLRIETSARWSPYVRGVEGWFFNIHPWSMMSPGGVRRGEIGVHRDANMPGCFDLNDTYVLTPEGWVDAITYDGSIPVAQMGGHGVLLWDLPRRVIKEYYSGKMIKHSANKMEMLVTPNHRIAHIPSGTILKGALNYTEASAAHQHYKQIAIPISGLLYGSKSMPEHEARLFIAFLADGYHQNNQTCWHLKKPRKIKRLKQILSEAGIEYKEYMRSNETIEIKIPKLAFSKDVQPESALDYCLTTKRIMLEEIVHWDGSSSGTKKQDPGEKKYSCYVTSTLKPHIDFFELLAITSGMSCTRSDYQDERNLSWSHMYTANIIDGRTCYRLTKPEVAGSWTVEEQDYSGIVFCLETPLSNFVIKHRGYVFITGNSAGCLVFENDDKFNNDFVPLMQAAAIAGIKEIPLEIDYLS